MAINNCPSCGRPYRRGDEVCASCGFVFPFSTVVLTAGTRLRDRYEIKQLIHSGGMGFVYLAEDKNLFDRICIVKQVRDRIQSKEHQQKLEEEALRMAKLSHPNVAMILDHFIDDEYYYLVMEYIRGQTLADVFEKRNRPLKENEVVKWAVAICNVLVYLHSEGIIHRDVSPDNIMLTTEGAIKFVDFGTLRELRNVLSGGTAGMGKFGYTPPEQWQGKPEPRSDIFALGATLYVLLTGFLPLSKEYQAGHGPQQADFNPEFPPIRKKNPRISTRCANILQKALQLDAGNRYASAFEMARELNELSNRLSSSSMPVRIKIKNSRLFAIALIAILVLSGIGTGMYYLVKYTQNISDNSDNGKATSQPVQNSQTQVPLLTTPPPKTPLSDAYGRIVVINHNNPSGFPLSPSIGMSFGAQIGYRDGLKMTDEMIFDTGYKLAPGTYTIWGKETTSWLLPVVIIDDPSGGSSSVSSNQVTVGLTAGETVTLTYFNTKAPLPSLSESASTDQENRENFGNSASRPFGFCYQSFKPTADQLTAVELLLRPGGLFPIVGTTSLVIIREDSPAGTILGYATAYVQSPDKLGDQIWVRFVFRSPVALTPGKEYLIGWYSSDSGILAWGCTLYNSYPGGSIVSPEGSSIEDEDFNFLTYYDTSDAGWTIYGDNEWEYFIDYPNQWTFSIQQNEPPANNYQSALITDLYAQTSIKCRYDQSKPITLSNRVNYMIYEGQKNYLTYTVLSRQNIAREDANEAIMLTTLEQYNESSPTMKVRKLLIETIMENRYYYYHVEVRVDASKYDSYLSTIDRIINSFRLNRTSTPPQEVSSFVGTQYVNSEYGFSFQYPTNWVEKTTDLPINVVKQFGVGTWFLMPSVWVTAVDQSTGATLQDAFYAWQTSVSCKPKTFTTTDITIDGVTCSKADVTYTNEIGDCKGTIVGFTRNNKWIIIGAVALPIIGGDWENETQKNDIINTIHFQPFRQ